jgi:hypothetical protein
MRVSTRVNYCCLVTFILHRFYTNKMLNKNTFFYCQMLNDIFDGNLGYATSWCFYFSEWNTGFYFTWKSQYFTGINVIKIR